ncbi:MAG: MBL fold metallo-hydrolase, partial [Dehalococcoidia bacterium]|nr:MBL fold metallo-hydrolase [Dehalococcoidia bacterium]
RLLRGGQGLGGLQKATIPERGRGVLRGLQGYEPSRVHADFLVIPTPGHTEGHCVLLYRDRFLFTGDHLWWDRERDRLGASQDVCWYSWDEQRKSMSRLLGFTSKLVMPGHGQRVKLPAEEMARHLAALARRM